MEVGKTYRVSRRLQKLPCLESDPDLEHTGIAVTHAFDQRAAAALRAKLSENGEGASFILKC